MKIELVKKLDKERVPVFLIKEGAKAERHPFAKFLSKEDITYLRAFEAKMPIKTGSTNMIFFPSGSRVFILGVEARAKFNHRRAILAARRAVSYARKERIKEIVVNLEDFATPFVKDSKAVAELIATQFELANFEFIAYKTAPPEGWSFVEGVFVASEKNSKTIVDALCAGQIIGWEINLARDLSNTPGGDMTPASLAEAAIRSGKQCGFKVSVLEKEEMEKLGMGGVLGVAKGSSELPKFIVMEYMKGKKSEKPTVLVGKGVTFDTGGLNLKPEQGIYEMHMDMTGGAGVIHTIAALARLKVKKNIIGLVPAVENMPSGSSYHPGDVLRTMSGKTIEILNTDAEGRVILADALTYAQRYNPRLVIDVATLTSSAMSALGQRASALFATTPALIKSFQEFGERTGDYVWPLPLWEEYEEDIKGTFGDVTNSTKSRYGGVVTAAAFLWQFIKNPPSKVSGHPPAAPAWVHLDIAPRMTAIEGEFLSKGAVGASIALLTAFLRKF